MLARWGAAALERTLASVHIQMQQQQQQGACIASQGAREGKQAHRQGHSGQEGHGPHTHSDTVTHTYTHPHNT